MFTVYVLKSRKDDKQYIAYTSNLERRLVEHDSGIAKSARSRKPSDRN